MYQYFDNFYPYNLYLKKMIHEDILKILFNTILFTSSLSNTNYLK